MATVLIAGASRGIGLETVKATLKAGHSVRALARSARRIPIDHPKSEKIAGDALEMATVKRALSGVDVVVQSLGVAAGLEAIFKPTRFFSKSDASAGHRNGGGSSQAVDLRDGLRGGQQPRPRRVSL
jgi:NAD(P)-dependent dehydrogenase (short-subunit alcohol dehydrogenase family)